VAGALAAAAWLEVKKAKPAETSIGGSSSISEARARRISMLHAPVETGVSLREPHSVQDPS
jgi:hypothetical protein